MFISALFIIAQNWQQPKCLSTNKWINKMWLSISMSIQLYVGNRKEWGTDTFYNMAEPWKHYAKWKKLVTKDNILYDLYEMSRIGKSVETERWIDAWAEQVGGKWGVLLMGMEFLLGCWSRWWLHNSEYTKTHSIIYFNGRVVCELCQ